MDISRQNKIQKFEDFVDQLQTRPRSRHCSTGQVFEQQKFFYMQADVQVEECTNLLVSIKAQIKLVCEGIRELLQLPAEKKPASDSECNF